METSFFVWPTIPNTKVRMIEETHGRQHHPPKGSVNKKLTICIYYIIAT